MGTCFRGILFPLQRYFEKHFHITFQIFPIWNGPVIKVSTRTGRFQLQIRKTVETFVITSKLKKSNFECIFTAPCFSIVILSCHEKMCLLKLGFQRDFPHQGYFMCFFCITLAINDLSCIYIQNRDFPAVQIDCFSSK